MSLGWANAGADVTVVEEVDRASGFAGSFRIGFVTPANQLIGEMEATMWTREEGRNELSFSLIAAAVTYYPGAEKGGYLRGGVGWGATTIVLDKNTGTEQTLQDRAGVGLLLGAGWEFRISKKVSLGPNVQWVYIKPDADFTKNADFLAFMLDLNYHY